MTILLFHMQGARVNGGTHNNGYTALHFAALSGNSLLCQILLQYGSKAEAVNSVGRTAAQMAAFVGKFFKTSGVGIVSNYAVDE